VKRATVLALGAIAVIAFALYLPFIGNPAVFDDRGLYSGHKFADYAAAPLGLDLRFPAYFSLAFVEVLWGRVEAHRLVSLALHIGCGWALFALIRQLGQTVLLALAGAAWFVVHPVAVYGAGYLVQRSIVLATLFGLLSLVAYLRGLQRNTYLHAIGAAALYSLAVLSKEHALLLPAAAAAAAPLAAASVRFAMRYTALYFAASLPAAVFVALLSRGIIGSTYEPQFEAITAEISRGQAAAAAVESPWLGSVLTQAAMFFRYLGLWFWPSTARMSIDLKVDFAQTLPSAVALPAVLGFLACGALGAYLVARRGRAGPAGFGLLFAWILFLVEFAVVRYQEPFVLYRSYLWAPGLAMMLVALLAALPRVAIAVAFVAVAVALPSQAVDRLQTFSSGTALWEDAVSKVPVGAVPGAARPLYLLGREYLYAGQPDKAIEVVQRCIARYPSAADCHFARAAIHMHMEEHKAALPYLLQAIALQPKAGGARHHLGLVLENLGCIEEAKEQYRIAARLGFVGGAHRLLRLESPGKGLLAPSAVPERQCPATVRELIRSAAPRPD